MDKASEIVEKRNWKDKLKQRKKTGDQSRGFYAVFLFLSFFAPFELMLGVFARNIIYPFGDQSFLFYDLLHQYMPFFQEFVEKIKAGEGLAYSWNVGMGSNFLALYGYYLASPLHWLAFLFPESRLVEFVSYLTIVKIGLAGLGAFLWLDSRQDQEKKLFVSFSAMLFSTFYAMSGYVAAYNVNIMWLDCIVLAPLILLGLERLVKKGRMGVYVLALALSILSNFYLSVMICLFLVLYFGCLFLTEQGKLRALWKFALGSLLAGALAAVILIPEAFALLDTDFAVASFPKKFETYFSILEVMARHCMGIATELEDGHWPNIYCGSAVFLMIPLYAVNHGISLKKRFLNLTLAGFFLASFQLNFLDYAWHGFNFPDCLPARQSFLYVLLVLTMCHDCFVHAGDLPVGHVIKAYSLAVLMLLMVEKFLKSDAFHAWDWLMTLAFVTGYAICLYCFLTRKEQKNHDLLAIAAYVLVLAECTINMSITSVSTTDRDAYAANAEDYKALWQRNAVTDGDFQRFEMLTRRTRNDAAVYGFPSATVFSSTMNSYVKNFHAKMGMRYSKVLYDHEGATPFVSALLNVGYFYSRDGKGEDELFHLVDQENGIYLYQSNYQLPFGYVAPLGFDVSREGTKNALELQNDLVRQLGIQEDLFREVESGNKVLSDFFVRENGIYYGVNYDPEVLELQISLTEGWTRSENFMKKGYVLRLGSLDAGDLVYFKNDETDRRLKVGEVQIYRLNEKVLEEAVKELGRRSLTQVKVENARVCGHLELEEAGRLITSVPREKGWKIYVNGKRTEPEYFGNAFLALDLEPGSYEIEMRYVPKGRGLGILISLMALAIFVGGMILMRGKARSRDGGTNHEEGK